MRTIPRGTGTVFLWSGYFGIRGTLEEYTKEQMCAVKMAGIYHKMGNSWC